MTIKNGGGSNSLVEPLRGGGVSNPMEHKEKNISFSSKEKMDEKSPKKNEPIWSRGKPDLSGSNTKETFYILLN